MDYISILLDEENIREMLDISYNLTGFLVDFSQMTFA
jgi:hypothetical protein